MRGIVFGRLLRSTLVAVAAAALAGGLPPSTHAQERAPERADPRLYGRVTTADGEVVEGYVRWDRNEASPWDFLDGMKEISLEVIREAERLDPDFAEEMRRQRSIVAFGMRIRWDEDDLSGPPRSASAIRFGHLASLEPVDLGRARLTLRSGEEVELVSSSTDLGVAMRDLRVERGGGEPFDLRWRDLARIDFLEPPETAPAPASARLHGTVSARSGHELTGYVGWDRDEILGSDELDGREGGVTHRIPFDEIESIEPVDRRSARVVLRSGAERILRGTNDVEGSIRGIEVSIPGLGRAIVDWEELVRVRFHERRSDDRIAGRPRWPDGTGERTAGFGRPIRGTVHAVDGRVLEGEIRWGHDEERRWEVLDGWSGGTDFEVEFGHIASIARGEEGVVVSLVDGGTLRLEGTDDVDEDQQGVFVTPDGRPRRLVRWRDVDRVVLAR